MPRPSGARRILSASITGAPYALRLYEVADGEEALAVYEHTMTALGWSRIDDAASARVFAKGDVHVFVAQSRTPDGKALLTLGELAYGGRDVDAHERPPHAPR